MTQYRHFDIHGGYKGLFFGTTLSVEKDIVIVWNQLTQVAAIRLAEGEWVALIPAPVEVTNPSDAG